MKLPPEKFIFADACTYKRVRIDGIFKLLIVPLAGIWGATISHWLSYLLPISFFAMVWFRIYMARNNWPFRHLRRGEGFFMISAPDSDMEFLSERRAKIKYYVEAAFLGAAGLFTLALNIMGLFDRYKI